MDSKSTRADVRVINGFVTPIRGDYYAFAPDKYISTNPQATLVIGDEAITKSKVVEMEARIGALKDELEKVLEWHRHETMPLRERELKSIADLLADNSITNL